MRPELVEFHWDDANRDHLARHQVLPVEAEQAILDPHAIFIEVQSHELEERTKVLGMTAKARLLEVVFVFRGVAIRPITAYDAPPRLQSRYFQGSHS